MSDAVVLDLPFTGRWRVQNSPAGRVPSHGVDLLGQRYAIDFVAVDDRGRSADRSDWRTYLATEPPERYVGFGAPILAPCSGTVVAVHDGEPDHAGRRSQLALVPYMLGQAGRLRQGVGAIAGNHVVIGIAGVSHYVALVHLRAASIRPKIGDTVDAGEPIAECGNSGNSTEPHLHLQVMDSADLSVARGVPLAFRDYRAGGTRVTAGIPGNGQIVEPL